MTSQLAWLMVMAHLGGAASCQPAPDDEIRLRPYADNPRYWQYRGRPLLLLGGSKDDSLFQIPDLEEHLDLMREVGANFIRNTMSDRQDHGFEVYPYQRRPDGRYDLEQWNPEYWRRFETLLRLTGERDVIVQIEVWDRFDHSQEQWDAGPYNPANNVNYTPEQSGLARHYPAPAWRDQQPFFHTIPGLPLYDQRLDLVRRYQERFVAKLLSYSLEHGHVLYCMDNETSTPPAWGRHWMAFIRERAREKGVSVWATDMFDDVWKPQTSASLRQAIDDPHAYPFLDVSQVNSRTFNQGHWENFLWIVEQMADSPRPLNHVKIYSDGNTSWGSGTPVDGVERFWRNLIAGAAACRFHRPGGGIGLNPIAQACIRAARKAESLAPFWEIEPRLDLLSEREEDEAYLAARPGQAYVLFFTDGGAVGLDLSGHPGPFAMRWIDVSTGEWGPEARLRGGRAAPVGAPGAGPWVAVVTREG